MPGVELTSAQKTLLLPGDEVGTLVETPAREETNPEARKRPVVRLGPGITQRGRELHASKCGMLCTDFKRNKLWLSVNQRRYVAALEDMVIGIVQERHADDYRLDLNGTDTATLAALSFEGATKKNKPNLVVGAVVYCRVTRASKNMETEVSCVEPGSSRSWTGGETLYGELKGGNLVQTSLGLARALMRSAQPVLARLGQHVAFQSAVGANGRVWLQAGNVRETIVLSQAIKKADVLQVDEWNSFVNKLFSKS